MQRICLLVFFLLTFSLSVKPSFAKDSIASSSSKPTVNVDYALPYPGLLPDSPLYFFRIARDRLIDFLISDPLKKSEFNLLQADKRLNAGIYLFNKGKASLAISTISKAENYFGEALEKMEEAKIQGKNIDNLLGRLNPAVKKHRQELEFLAEKADKNLRPAFEKELKRVIGFEERLNK